jgi:hypothetical protein
MIANLTNLEDRIFGESPKAGPPRRPLPITADHSFLSLRERTEVRVKI